MQAPSQSDNAPWVHQSGQKGDDLEACQNWFGEANRPRSGSIFVVVSLHGPVCSEGRKARSKHVGSRIGLPRSLQVLPLVSALEGPYKNYCVSVSAFVKWDCWSMK